MTSNVPQRVRFAIATRRGIAYVQSHLFASLRALYSALWLGILDDRDVAMVTAMSYRDSDLYRSDGHNLGGLFGWERTAVERVFAPGSAVLVPSAGGGREVIALASLGYDPVGFDPSAELVETAQRLIEAAGHSVEVVVSPPDELPPGLERRFDAILFGWGSYSHIRSRSARVAFLRGLRTRVGPGAPMVISFLGRPSASLTFRFVATVAAFIRSARRSPERIELGDLIFAHYLHHFTIEEIGSELADGGFEAVEFLNVHFNHAICRAV